MRHRLRLFTGEEQGSQVAEPSVSVRFREITQALAEAVRSDRAWLSDFADDEVQVSPDLYEVLVSITRYRPGA